MSTYTAPAVNSIQAVVRRLIDGLSCPNCGRVLRASDFELTGDGARIVCVGDDCGRLILEIELEIELDEIES